MGLSFAGGDGHVVLVVVVAIEKKAEKRKLCLGHFLFILVVALVSFIIIITSKVAKNK